MAHSFVCSYYHLIWSTCQRRPLIRPEIAERLWPYIAGIARQEKIKQEHHHKRTFEEEFLMLLDRHGITYDPQQVFG